MRALLLAQGGQVGLGHLARSTALAQALQMRGAKVEARVLDFERRIEVDGLPWRPDDGRQDEPADVVIIDSYEISTGRLEALDAGQRFWMHSPKAPAGSDDPFLELDRAPGDDSEARCHGIGCACLRRAYWPGPAPREPAAELGSILVTVGGSDAGGPVGDLAAMVRDAAPAAAVTMIRGPRSSSATPDGVAVADAPDGLHDLLAHADLVVTAAGQTMLEALASGIPTVALVRVENQRAQATLVGRRKAALITDESALADLVAGLSADPAARRRLAEAGPQLVDGLGAHRVADGIVERLAGSPSFSCFGVRLRPATPADRDFLFELRNDPSAYPLYGTPRPVEPAEHEAWLERALASAAHRLLVIEQEGRAVGQLRLDFDQSDSRASERAELSISLGAGARGAGLGRRAIAAGALLAWIREGAGPIRAEIHPDNPGSLRAFGAVGFEPAGTTPGGFEELVLQRRGFGWSGELG